MVFIAVSIPRLARMDNSQYKPSLEAHANNAHCLAKVHLCFVFGIGFSRWFLFLLLFFLFFVFSITYSALFILIQAVNALAAALFTVSGQGDIEERLKEFLALASSSLLKLGLETLDKV